MEIILEQLTRSIKSIGKEAKQFSYVNVMITYTENPGKSTKASYKWYDSKFAKYNINIQISVQKVGYL